MKLCQQCYKPKTLETTLCKECRDHNKSVEEGWPEMLFEGLIASPESCYICGNWKANGALYTPGTSNPLIPICVNCQFGWNFYGYEILKKIKKGYGKIIVKLFIFNPLHPYKVYKKLSKIKNWGLKMKKFMKSKN